MTGDKQVEVHYAAHLHAGRYKPGDHHEGLIRESNHSFGFVEASVWFRD